MNIKGTNKADHLVGTASDDTIEGLRGNVSAVISFVSPTELYKYCGMKVEIGKTLLGCAADKPWRRIFLSNPCLSLEQLWAKEACHELGHLNGWTEAHGP